MHEWDGQTPLEETLERARHARPLRQGPLRRLLQLRRLAADEGARRSPSGAATSASSRQQIHYSLQAREAEYELVPVALDQGVGILVWSPLAGGLLSGKYRRGQDAPEGSRHLTDWNEPPVRDEEQLYDIVDVLVEIAEAHGVSAAQVALAWLLGAPGRRVGGRRRAHRASSSPTTSPPPTSRSPTTSARGSTRSARRRCCTRTGTRRRRRSDRLSEADLTLLGPHI